MTSPRIRLAQAEDLPRLPEIERSAADLFVGSGKPMEVLTNVNPAETWSRMQAAGTVWVADSGDGEPVGFLAAEVFGDELHVWELDVRVDRQGQGLGRRLLAAAIDWARERRLHGLTLTTYRDVPWNGPFYASMGFAEATGAELSARLAQVLALEASKGLDPAERCAMSLELQRIGGA